MFKHVWPRQASNRLLRNQDQAAVRRSLAGAEPEPVLEHRPYGSNAYSRARQGERHAAAGVDEMGSHSLLVERRKDEAPDVQRQSRDGHEAPDIQERLGSRASLSR